MTGCLLLLLLTTKTWEPLLFYILPWLRAMDAGGLGPARQGRSSCARCVGECASPAQAEFWQIPTGRKSCRGGWTLIPFLGSENVPHIRAKTIKKKTEAQSLLCRRQKQLGCFSGFDHD